MERELTLDEIRLSRQINTLALAFETNVSHRYPNVTQDRTHGGFQHRLHLGQLLVHRLAPRVDLDLGRNLLASVLRHLTSHITKVALDSWLRFDTTPSRLTVDCQTLFPPERCVENSRTPTAAQGTVRPHRGALFYFHSMALVCTGDISQRVSDESFPVVPTKWPGRLLADADNMHKLGKVAWPHIPPKVFPIGIRLSCQDAFRKKFLFPPSTHL